MKYREPSMNETAVAWGDDSLACASYSTSRNWFARQRCPFRRSTTASRFALTREYGRA